MSESRGPDRVAKLLAVLLGVGALRMLLMVAWQCDDAYISHRTAALLVDGHGLGWNPGERVQAFTHPLWLLVSVGGHLVTGEAFVSVLVVSIGLTLAALWGVARVAPQRRAGLAVAALLSASAAVVDWGVSGLENPLLFCLVVAAVPLARAVDDGRRMVGLGLLVSALFLTRPDAPLLVAPLVLHAWWTHGDGRLRGLLALAVGALPMVAWELFSLVWFGSLVPNTAIAKLNVELPAAAVWGQGLIYVLDAVRRDPLVAVFLVAGPLTAGLTRRPRLLALALGGWLYTLYVVRIGGDFMAMRFLAAPTVLGAAVLAASLPELCRHRLLAGSVLAVACGLLLPGSRWLDDGWYLDHLEPQERIARNHGIVDERAYYTPGASWAFVRRQAQGIADEGLTIPVAPRAAQGRDEAAAGLTLQVMPYIGYYGYFAGDRIYVVDPHGLSDAFLARVPFAAPDGDFRPGHLPRPVTDAYLQSVQAGAGRFGDAELDAAFDAVWLVTHGPLWSAERWRAIAALHTGVHAPAFARYASGAGG